MQPQMHSQMPMHQPQTMQHTGPQFTGQAAQQQHAQLSRPWPPPMQQQPPTSASLDELLTAAQLDAFRTPIEAMGVAFIADFQDVEDQDLHVIGCGLSKIQVKRLRRKLLEMTM
jgi:hypothetical protein